MSQTEGPGRPWREATTRQIAISDQINPLLPSLSACKEKASSEKAATSDWTVEAAGSLGQSWRVVGGHPCPNVRGDE